MGPHKPNVTEHVAYYRPMRSVKKYETMSEIAQRTEIEDMIDDSEIGLDGVFGKYSAKTELLEFGLNHCLQKEGYTTVQIVKKFTAFGVDMTKCSRWFGDKSPLFCIRNSDRSDHKALIEDLRKRF